MFADSIVFICAHNIDGCMGFIINKPHELTLDGLLDRVDGVEHDAIASANSLVSPHQLIRMGGPVDENRGFILHSSDYEADATIPVTEDISLTSTLSILHDIANQRGPRQAMVSLGYAAWEYNQLEQEIADNDWLTLDTLPDDLVFNDQLIDKYDDALGMIGIRSRALYVSEPGHA